MINVSYVETTVRHVNCDFCEKKYKTLSVYYTNLPNMMIPTPAQTIFKYKLYSKIYICGETCLNLWIFRANNYL